MNEQIQKATKKGLSLNQTIAIAQKYAAAHGYRVGSVEVKAVWAATRKEMGL